ncbi:hypothetical protein CHU98_g501 [Xylaria longipes]|nr:hypothetical protein CHU98_g501 [Xylaria longipes]
MPIAAVCNRSLRLVPRNIRKASKHGLYIPRRQLSLFDKLFRRDQESPKSTTDSDRSPRLDQQPSESTADSGKDGQPPRQPSQVDQFLKLHQEPVTASGNNGQPPRQPSQFDQFFPLDQQPSKPSKPSAFRRFRNTRTMKTAKFSPPGTKPHKHGHYWQCESEGYNSRIAYSKTRAATPLVVSRSWLRDACTCQRCVNPSSGQKNYASADVPFYLDIRSLSVTNEGDLLVHWENDFHTNDLHVSRYSPALWDREELVELETIPEPKPWHRLAMTEASPYYSYQSFMTDGSEYRQAMTALSELGLIFLRNVPSSEETVKDIASRLGLIQNTFYGTTWDVKSKPNAENVAYTSSYLGLHQDLLYMSNVPRIQILHCLENTCEGGESIFRDGYRVAHKFRQTYPSGVGPLTDRKVAYHYNKGGHAYRSERAVLPDPGSSEQGIWWSPPFQSPVQPDEPTPEAMGGYKRWLKAARRMKRLLEEYEGIYEYKMQPGECVIFDNRRVLHGRREFDTSSGERWLKGTYVENDSFNSRLKSLKLTLLF